MRDKIKVSDFFKSGVAVTHPVGVEIVEIASSLGDEYKHVATVRDEETALIILECISSYDELSMEVKRLGRLELGVSQLERLKRACVNMGIATPESLEDLGVSQCHYIRMLIDGVIDL